MSGKRNLLSSNGTGLLVNPVLSQSKGEQLQGRARRSSSKRPRLRISHRFSGACKANEIYYHRRKGPSSRIRRAANCK